MLAQKNTTINSYRLSYLIQYRILKIPVRVKIKSVLFPETSLIFDNALIFRDMNLHTVTTKIRSLPCINTLSCPFNCQKCQHSQ